MFTIRIGYMLPCFMLFFSPLPVLLNGEENTPAKQESTLENDPGTESADRYGETPLHRAVRSGDVVLLRKLLGENHELNRRNIAGFSALALAAWHGNEKAVALLLKHGAEIDPACKTDREMLFKPCERREIGIVTLLLEHNAELLCNATKNDITPLEALLRSREWRQDVRQLRIATLLVKNSSNDNWNDIALSIVGLSLHRQSFLRQREWDMSKNGAVVSAKREFDILLVERMNDIDKQNRNHENVLLNAVKQGDLEVVRKVLEKGADPNFVSIAGTPMEFAVCHGIAMTRLLLEYGAVADLGSSPALVNALIIDDEAVADLLWEKGARFNINHGGEAMTQAVLYDKPVLVKRLLESGVSPDAKTERSLSESPLRTAVSKRNVEIVRLLIDAGGDLNELDYLGTSLLHKAVSSGDIEIVRSLIEKGVGINVQNKGGATPLTIAAKKGFTEIVDLLLQHGADADLRMRQSSNSMDGTYRAGMTALHFASENGHSDIVERLLGSGAKLLRDVEGKTPVDYSMNWKTRITFENFLRK